MPTIVNKRVAYNGDYANLQLAFDDIVANYSNLVARDEQWNLYLGQSAAGNNLWTLGFFQQYVFGAANAQTVITDSTRFVRILPEPGTGFGENPNKLNNELKFNPANGVAIQAGNQAFQIFVMHTQIIGLQIRITGGDNSVAYAIFTASSRAAGSLSTNCLIETNRNDGRFSAVNGVISNSIIIVNDQPAISGNGKFSNCTVISKSLSLPTSAAIKPSFGDIISSNNCFFNFSTISEPGLSSSSSHNATDLLVAPSNFGSNSLLGVNPSDQFVSTNPASFDLRLKSGSVLVGAGVRESQLTKDIDIIYESRSLTNPSIGAWETPWDVPRGVTIQSDQTIAKGIARGIERGIV
jgi:hypothetical protein